MNQVRTWADLTSFYIKKENIANKQNNFAQYLDSLLINLCLKQGFDDKKNIELLSYVIIKLCNQYDNGHICLPLSKLSSEYLEILYKCPIIGFKNQNFPLIIDQGNLYFLRYYNYEEKSAEKLLNLASQEIQSFDKKIYQDLKQTSLNENETDYQHLAVFLALRNKLTVISGGPGTGKTVTAVKILTNLAKQGFKNIAVAAPTGKAATKLGLELDKNWPIELKKPKFSTIHRLLGFSNSNKFYNEKLSTMDVFLIDEVSMLDLSILSKLLKLIPDKAKLILIGDKNQLSSVQPGSVFADICGAKNINSFSTSCIADYAKISNSALLHAKQNYALTDSIVMLEKTYRFKENSGIFAACQALRNKDTFALDNILAGKYDDFVFLPQFEPDFIKKLILRGFTSYVEAKFDEMFVAFNKFKIICAHRFGNLGVTDLNKFVEKTLVEQNLLNLNCNYYENRPILILENNYQLNLFNGTTGICRFLDNGPRIYIENENQYKILKPNSLPENATCFAMTVHKSQGMEFDEVLVILPQKLSPVLNRELLYTALSRAKKKVYLVAKPEIVKACFNKQTLRDSGLYQRLWDIK